MKKETNFAEKKALLEMVERVLEEVERMDKSYSTEYGVVTDEDGNPVMKQKTKWENFEYVPVLDDDGNPVMVEVYDYIPLKEEDICDEYKANIKALEIIYNTLVKLV